MQWDYHLFALINGLVGHSSLLDNFMVLVAKWGVVFYGLILLYLFFQKQKANLRDQRLLVVRAVLAAGIALLINQLIGLAYFRPRPFAQHPDHLLIDRSTDPSFPSDHATGSSSLTFAVASEQPAIGYLMYFFTILLMFSRVYVGTHYPLDVLGGMVTGYVGSYLAQRIWPLCEQHVTKLLTFWESWSLKVVNSFSLWK